MPFEPGNTLSTGRPLGTKSTLKVRFERELLADFEANGAEAIARVRKESPTDYLRLIASLIPKNVNLKQEVDVTHRTESVSATDRWISETLGLGADDEVQKHLPN